MTTINTSSISPYSSAYTTPVRTDPTSQSDASTASVDLRGNVYTEPGKKAGEAESSGTTREQMTKRLQEQIKQTQKTLEQQQQQLAAAQASKGSEQEKAAQVMAIQQQIAGTNAQLVALQAALMQLIKGTVDTTA